MVGLIFSVQSLIGASSAEQTSAEIFINKYKFQYQQEPHRESYKKFFDNLFSIIVKFVMACGSKLIKNACSSESTIVVC